MVSLYDGKYIGHWVDLWAGWRFGYLFWTTSIERSHLRRPCPNEIKKAKWEKRKKEKKNEWKREKNEISTGGKERNEGREIRI